MKKTILITGGCGFIGSNFIHYMKDIYPDYTLINVDCLTYSGNLENLKEIENYPHYHFIKGDITDEQLIAEVFKRQSHRGSCSFCG